MLGGMTAEEFVEWQVFARHEPIGPRRLDYLFAILVRTLYHVNSRKGKQPPPLDKFIPSWWDKAKSEQNSLEILRFVTEFTKAAGGEVPETVAEVLASGDLPREDDGDPRP